MSLMHVRDILTRSFIIFTFLSVFSTLISFKSIKPSFRERNAKDAYTKALRAYVPNIGCH